MIRKNLASMLTRKITRGRLNEFLNIHATDKKTLDIGCGGSPYAGYFPNRVAIDISKSRSTELLADAHSLPFRDASFDVILCTEVLEHLKEPQRAIEEMERVLIDGGKLILTTRFIFPLHDTPDDYYRFTKYGLRYLLRNWKITEMREETDTVGSIAVLLQRMGFQCVFRFKLFNYIFHALAHLLKHLNFIIKKEYGVFYEKVPESNIMTSGYYVIAEKSKDEEQL